MGGAERPPSAFTGPIAWAIFFGDHTMKNPLLSFALAAAIFAISSGNVANALQIGDFFQNAEVIKANSVKVVNESLIKVNTTIKGYSANSPYAIKTIDVPKATFMSHVRNNLSSLTKRNAWYAGWFATVGAAGWAIDELHNQMVSVPVNTSKDKIYCWGSVGGPYGMGCSHNPKDTAINQCKMGGARTCGDVISVSPVTNRPGSYIYQINTSQGQMGFQVNPFTCSPTSAEPYASFCASELPKEAVSDAALYESLAAEMLKDPKAAAQAFMVPDAWPYPYPHLFPDPVKYIPGVSEADEQLLDALIKGQLQTTNPSAANYVTPEKLQQLQNMLSQLQQGLTPEGQVGSANDKLKDALTQAQLEETIKKEKEKEEKAVKDALGEKPSFDKLTEPLDKFVDNVNKTPQDEINPLPQNTFGIAGSGTCYLIQKPISIMGVTVDMSTRSFCEAYYYPYFLPILTWFFYIATGLYIWFSLRDAYSRRI